MVKKSFFSNLVAKTPNPSHSLRKTWSTCFEASGIRTTKLILLLSLRLMNHIAWKVERKKKVGTNYHSPSSAGNSKVKGRSQIMVTS